MGTGYFLVRGDKTTCGGKIIEGADDHTIMGIPQARDMDRVTCGRYPGMFIIVGGVPETDIHGRLMAGTLDSQSSCPCKARFIASMMDDVYETGGGDGGEDDQDDSNNGKATGQNTPTIKKDFTPENDDPSVTPVFAKSCLRGSGCTDAGTESEPVDNFGEMSFYQAAAMAGTITHTGASESASSAALRLIGKAASRVLPGRLAVPNPVTVGVIGIFWSEGLNKGEEDYLNNIRLTQLATLQGTAPTRVRFQWVTNAITGKPEIRGYHTGSDGQISDQVPVRMLTPNAGHKDLYEFWESGAKGPSILWTPDNPGYAPPSDTGNDDVFVPPPSILIYPLPTDTGSSTEILPMPEEKDFRDYILVHPTGDFDPIYVVLSKPPVEFLEVELYIDFTGRSRDGQYAADHMPSAAAVKARLKELNPELTPAELNVLAKKVASVVYPAEIHKDFSETFAGRNQPHVIDRDSRDLRAAADRNLDAVIPALKKRGATDKQLESVRARIHELNQKQGLY
ncbi:S-type pyocin domain-containing protein [Escherichia coli]|uniref:S-type pyocin domain-containing protein n=5 Tax=Gammaproteobacteria TaxID=1236 RepID=UPI0010CB80E9|nr:S-type pyocin domain-containing protein [Escherichia coli]EIE2982313.1 S-type pyocin domain-containing protein [Escherichia coli]ELO3135235.1 S-type pyocin domain-containing protein [Escherichia coli]MCN6743665.1 S-type pyocin domain-containing protein [Escherichia coli]MCN8881430.1 S-type pyocin domain-containing protein [Escherichia coli]GCW69088.1 hypothetical protein HmCmsJML063_01694 [Escherichia coli]